MQTYKTYSLYRKRCVEKQQHVIFSFFSSFTIIDFSSLSLSLSLITTVPFSKHKAYFNPSLVQQKSTPVLFKGYLEAAFSLEIV